MRSKDPIYFRYTKRQLYTSVRRAFGYARVCVKEHCTLQQTHTLEDICRESQDWASAKPCFLINWSNYDLAELLLGHPCAITFWPRCETRDERYSSSAHTRAVFHQRTPASFGLSFRSTGRPFPSQFSLINVSVFLFSIVSIENLYFEQFNNTNFQKNLMGNL